MREQAKAMLKVARILDPLNPTDLLEVIRMINRNYGGPLSAADRMLELRKRRNCSDEEPVTVRDDIHVTAVTKRTKVSSSYESFPGFCSFWSLYPRRIGKDAAFLSWKRSGCESISEVVVQAVREQLPYLVREGGQFRPLPATWLNQGRWKDEPYNTTSEGTIVRPAAPEPTPLTDEEHAEVLGQIRGVVTGLTAEKGGGKPPRSAHALSEEQDRVRLETLRRKKI